MKELEKVLIARTTDLEKNYTRIVPTRDYGLGFHGEIRRLEKKPKLSKKARRQARAK
jgi:hypothetical protein